MNKQDIINNWDIYYKSYLKLNPDLTFSAINTKRSLLNHFIKYGYDEGRPYSENQPYIPKIESNNDIQSNQSISIIKSSDKFYLEERMIIEKIDLNL